jgi:hypothetical protein
MSKSACREGRDVLSPFAFVGGREKRGEDEEEERGEKLEGTTPF